MSKCKSVVTVRVYREELTLPPYELDDPFCHECVSHGLHSNGYVQLKRDGFHYAHRWVYWQYTGETPEVVMHLCDNRGCLNPAHLVAGTNEENIHDRDDKGRTRSRGRACLSADVVRAIRAAEGSYQEIADRFGVSKSGVFGIKHRLSHHNVLD